MTTFKSTLILPLYLQYVLQYHEGTVWKRSKLLAKMQFLWFKRFTVARFEFVVFFFFF